VKALTLQQFRSACAVVDSGFNVSRSAQALHTTQSAVSKTIKALEDELGAMIFERASVRIVGLTAYGKDFIQLARGIVRDAEIAVTRAQEDVKGTRGVFRIATTHVHARYSLPRAIHALRAKYPEVSVEIEQSDAAEVGRWVSSRRVQLGVAGNSVEPPTGVIALHAMKLERCIVVPPGHELLGIKMPTLADVARYPLVSYTEHHSAGSRLRELFQQHGLRPRVVLTAADASVLKEYVAAGLGIAILHKIAITPEDERRLAVIGASHLMPCTETQLLFRQGEYLRGYVYEFAEAFSPQWSRQSMMCEIERQSAHSGHRLGSARHCRSRATFSTASTP
jgi:LysR family cys regulon transcriptional activator